MSDAFASWKQHGTAALELLRTEDNKAYCQLMAGCCQRTASFGPIYGATASDGHFGTLLSEPLLSDTNQSSLLAQSHG